MYKRHHFHPDSLKLVLTERHGVIQAERDTGGLQSNRPLPKAGLDKRSDQGAQVFRWVLATSEDGDTAAFFVNILHCLAVLTVKKTFFTSRLNLLSFSLCLLSLTVPSQ